MLIAKSNDCPRCGTGHANSCFVTYHNGWHCFSCGASYVTDKDSYSFRPSQTVNTNIYLPQNIITNYSQFSLGTIEWLYKFGVYKEFIQQHHIGYVPFEEFVTKHNLRYSGESLIFPIINNNEIVYYQRRFFPNKQILTVGNANALFIARKGVQNSRTIVIVEDYISAIRVGQIHHCMCLFGTKLKALQLSYILENYTNIKVWLDGDAPGQDSAKKIRKQLYDTIKYKCAQLAFKQQIYSIENIFTEKDPKYYTNTEICTILNKNRE